MRHGWIGMFDMVEFMAGRAGRWILAVACLLAFGIRPAPAIAAGGVHDPGFAYVDADNDGLFGPGDVADILPFILDDGVFDASVSERGPGGRFYAGRPGAGVVIPPSVGLVVPDPAKRYFSFSISADGHVLAEAPIRAQRPHHAPGTLALRSRKRDVAVGDGSPGVEFFARFFVLEAALAVDASGTRLVGKWGCAIRIRSGKGTSLAGSYIHIRRLEVSSGGPLDARGAFVHFHASSSVTVDLQAAGHAYLGALPAGTPATIMARFLSVLARGGDVLAAGARLSRTPSTGSWIRLEARNGAGGAGGSVDVTEAYLRTGRTISLVGGSPSGGDQVIVSGAVFDDQDDTAAVCPRGIPIVGTPLHPYRAAYGPCP